jgi:lysozyme
MPSLQALLYAVLALTTTTFAAVNGRCSIDGISGVCIPSAKCTESGGANRVGFCPNDPTDIRCCTKPSCADGGNCQWTTECTGATKSGLCPGPANFKCCLTSEGGGSGETTSHDISANGVKFIAGFEGFRKDFYTDDAVRLHDQITPSLAYILS